MKLKLLLKKYLFYKIRLLTLTHNNTLGNKSFIVCRNIGLGMLVSLLKIKTKRHLHNNKCSFKRGEVNLNY